MLLSRPTTTQEMLNNRYSLTIPNIYNFQKYIRYSNMIMQRPSLNLTHVKTKQEEFLDAINSGLTEAANPLNDNNAEFLKQSLNLSQVLQDNFNPNMTNAEISDKIKDLINDTFNEFNQTIVDQKNKINSQLVSMFNSGALRSYLDRLAGKPVNMDTMKQELLNTKKLLINIAAQEYDDPIQKLEYLNRLLEDPNLNEIIMSMNIIEKTQEAIDSLPGDRPIRVPMPMPSPIDLETTSRIDDVDGEMRDIIDVESMGERTFLDKLGDLGFGDSTMGSTRADESTLFTETVPETNTEMTGVQNLHNKLLADMEKYKIKGLYSFNTLAERIKVGDIFSVRGAKINREQLFHHGSHTVRNIYKINEVDDNDNYNYVTTQNILTGREVTFTKLGIEEKAIIYVFYKEPTTDILTEMVNDKVFVDLTSNLVNIKKFIVNTTSREAVLDTSLFSNEMDK